MVDETLDFPDEAGMIEIPAEFNSRNDLGEQVAIVDRRRELSPWHRPRKHYVRTRQWSASLKALIASRTTTDEPIRYLGLPGDEFLDIRHLASDAMPDSGVKLRFLGFNDGIDDGVVTLNEVGRVTSVDEVLHRPEVDEVSSQVMPDDIRRIAAPDSPAHRAATAMGPFDVINLDLCQSFFVAPPDGNHSYTRALRQIMGIQGRASGDWLLWITTRVNREAVNEVTAQKLLHLIRRRFDECAYVVDEWSQVFDSASPHDLELGTCSEDDFANLMFVGLALWLFSLATGPVKHNVNVQSNFSYRILHEPPDSPDMHSAVFRFSPKMPVPEDYSGVTPAVLDHELPSKCQKLEHIVSRLASTVNIDRRLKTEEGLRDELVSATADLLEDARVDRDHYLEWVAQHAS